MCCIKTSLHIDGKVVVWAIYIKNILDFEKYLLSCGIPCKTLYGATPVTTGEEDEDEVETREKIIAEFHKPDSSFKVIIANPFAVSESISLHKACHNARMYLSALILATSDSFSDQKKCGDPM